MSGKALTGFIKSAALDAVLLDELHLERTDVQLQGGVQVQEEVRAIAVTRLEADRLRVTIRLSLVGRTGSAEQLATGQVPTDAPVAFRLSAAVSAFYRCSVTETSAEVVELFAQTSAVAHLTAYLRQFVQESLARAGFPGVVMPLVPIAAPGAAVRTGQADKA